MGTLTSLLQVTTRTLSAYQAALTATAENISKQNQEGYTRRLVSFQSGDMVTLSGGTTTSTGVSATVTAQRDAILQRAVLQATEASSSSSTRLAALNNLQSLFAINSSGEDATGIGAAISNFFSSANSLASTPNDATARQTVYINAQALASTLNRAASQLALQTSALNQRVSASVDGVNALLTSVASLNKEIVTAGAGTDTSTLQDQRDLAISQLAKVVDVNPVAAKDGSIDLSLSDGTSLVSGTQTSLLHTAYASGSLRILSGSTDVTLNLHGGSIGGALQARDTDIPVVSAQLDAITNAIATGVNAQNAAGLDASGNPGAPIFAGTTAADITVVASSSSAIAAGADGSNAAALAALGSQASVGGQSPSAAFASLLTSLGQAASAAGLNSAADKAVLTQTSTQLAAITSVSLDTEAENLTQYQRSYQSAAKILSIVNTLMAQAINLGTETSVS